MIQDCINILGDRELIFDTPITVKKTPHHHLFTIYGAVAVKCQLWLLDGGGEWHQIEEKQMNAEYVIASLLQRLKLIQHETSIAN